MGFLVSSSLSLVAHVAFDVGSGVLFSPALSSVLKLHSSPSSLIIFLAYTLEAPWCRLSCITALHIGYLFILAFSRLHLELMFKPTFDLDFLYKLTIACT